MPQIFIIKKKFMVVDEYFDHKVHKDCSLPLILKKLAGESEHTH